MNTFRFDAPSQNWLSPDSRALSNSLVTTSPGPDLQQLASEVARLAETDTASAAEVLRDLFALTPPSSNGEFAGAIAGQLDDGTLSALAQAPAGREIIALLDRFISAGSIGPEQQAQLGRLQDAQFVTTNTPAWAGLALPHTLTPALMHATAQVSSTVRPEPTPEEKVKSAFEQEFAAKAGNKEEFDALMKQVYGDNY